MPYGTVGGQTAVGLQAASRIFFDKPAEQADAAPGRAARGPPAGARRVYNPFLRPQRAKQRRDEVLRQMAEQGYITQRPAAATMRARLGVKHNRYYTERRESYFFDYVKPELIDALRPATRSARAGCASTRRSTCTSSAARASDGRPAGRPDRAAAIVSIDPRNGLDQGDGVVARYGHSKFNLASQGAPPAGSTFKVMVLMTALRRGVDPDTTTYVSRPLQADWPTYRADTTSRRTRTTTRAR